MYAIGADGDRLWTHRISDVVINPLVAARDTVVVSGGARGGNVHKTRAYHRDGTPAWSRNSAEVATELMDGDGQVYLQPWTDVGVPAKRAVAVSMTTGEVALRIDNTMDPMAARPEDRVVIATIDSQTFGRRMVALDTWGGNTRWDYPMSTFTSIRNVAVNAQRLYYVKAGDDLLVARSATSGEVHWRNPVPGTGVERNVVAAGGLVYVIFQSSGDLGYRLVAYDAADGTEVARRRIAGSRWANHPVIANGTLYLRTNTGLRAYRPSA